MGIEATKDRLRSNNARLMHLIYIIKYFNFSKKISKKLR